MVYFSMQIIEVNLDYGNHENYCKSIPCEFEVSLTVPEEI